MKSQESNIALFFHIIPPHVDWCSAEPELPLFTAAWESLQKSSAVVDVKCRLWEFTQVMLLKM